MYRVIQNRVLWLVIAIGAAFVLLLLLGFLLLVQDEPSYHGKPLGYWINAIVENDPELRVEATVVFQELLHDEDPKMRATAAFYLGRASPTNINLSLSIIPCLHDTDNLVRKSAVHGLMFFHPKDDRVILALMKVLRFDSDYEVRGAAFAVLLVCSDECKPGIDELIDMLGDRDPESRSHAAWILGSMGRDGRQAVPQLRKALDDDVEWVRRAASEALNRIEGPDRLF